MTKYRSPEHTIRDMYESSVIGGRKTGSRGLAFRRISTSKPDEWRDKKGSEVGAARNYANQQASYDKERESENEKEKEVEKRNREAEQRKKETMSMAKEELEEAKIKGSRMPGRSLLGDPRVQKALMVQKTLQGKGSLAPKEPEKKEVTKEEAEASGTVERRKIENVARPDDPSPTSSASKLSKQEEIKKKVIDEGKMLKSDNKFGLPDSVIEAARSLMNGKTVVDTAPETNDKDVDESKKKSLAALAHPKDKITKKDILVGRGVLAKEEVEIDDLTEEQLEEVLKKSDPAGKWISDFVHSKDPKFAGKTKKERMKQALAAYYAKQRNEEVEQVDEKITSRTYRDIEDKRRATPADPNEPRGTKKKSIDAVRQLGKRGMGQITHMGYGSKPDPQGRRVLHPPYVIGAGPKGKLPEEVELSDDEISRLEEISKQFD